MLRQAERPADTGRLLAVNDRTRWNEMIERIPDAFMSQLWEWGEVRQAFGWEAHRLVLEPASGDDLPRAALQVVVRRMPVIGLGIGHSPRGPLGLRSSADVAALVGPLRVWARTQRIATLLVDPVVRADSDLAAALMAKPWTLAPSVGENRVHVLDLAEADPWASVRRKHREWVRRAERERVNVTWYDQSSSDGAARDAIVAFHAVYAQIVERLALVTHGAGFNQQVWEVFRRGGRAQLGIARHDGTPVAAMLHITVGDTMVWYAGGQANGRDPLGAGKLLLWRSILRARELGLRRYHMWGTATDSLAHYKEGFGAKEERYIGTRALAALPAGDRLVRTAWAAQRLGLRVRGRRGARPRAATAPGKPE